MKKGKLHRISDVFYNVNMLEGAIPVVQEDGMFVVRNFTIIKAGLSANRNFYSPEVLRRDHRVFEGIPIRTDHPEGGKRPSVRDIVGKVSKVRFCEDDKTIRGDAVFSSVEGDLVTKVKENLIGDMSINAFGIAALEKGPDGKVRRRIDTIKSANSVDLVCAASAGGTLHEEKRQASLVCERMVRVMEGLENLTLDELRKTRPDLCESIKKEAQPSSVPASGTTTPAVDITKIEEAVAKKVGSILDGFKKDLDAKETARHLSESINTAIDEVLEESTMVDEARPVIRKSLSAFAVKGFKDVDSIDKAKLSEERDSLLDSFKELAKKIVESSDEPDGKKKKKKKKTEKKSIYEFSL
jgi:hypothetical protein